MELCEVRNQIIESIPFIKDKISRKTLDKVNELLDQDVELRTNLFDNLATFKGVLQEGNYTIDNFINASIYVSYTTLGVTKMTSYAKVYPLRMLKFAQDNKSTKVISGIVNAYSRSVLVQKLLAEFQMPSHVMFREVFYKAIATQEGILDDPRVSATVKQKAACSLMGHLKEPEVQKMEIAVTNTGESDMIKELLDASNKLANQQIKAIKEGRSSAKEVAHSTIIEGECSEKE